MNRVAISIKNVSMRLVAELIVLVAFVEGESYVASQGKSAVDLMLSDLNVRPS
jgi:hypothetical protein